MQLPLLICCRSYCVGEASEYPGGPPPVTVFSTGRSDWKGLLHLPPICLAAMEVLPSLIPWLAGDSLKQNLESPISARQSSLAIVQRRAPIKKIRHGDCRL